MTRRLKKKLRWKKKVIPTNWKKGKSTTKTTQNSKNAVNVHRDKDKKKGHGQTSDGNVEKRLGESLKKSISEFERKAIAYRIFVKMSQYSLTREERDELVKKYGEELSEPFIDLEKICSKTSDYKVINSIIEKWLKKEGRNPIKDKSPQTQLEEYLRDHADEETGKILTRHAKSRE